MSGGPVDHHRVLELAAGDGAHLAAQRRQRGGDPPAQRPEERQADDHGQHGRADDEAEQQLGRGPQLVARVPAGVGDAAAEPRRSRLRIVSNICLPRPNATAGMAP